MKRGEVFAAPYRRNNEAMWGCLLAQPRAEWIDFAQLAKESGLSASAVYRPLYRWADRGWLEVDRSKRPSRARLTSHGRVQVRIWLGEDA